MKKLIQNLIARALRISGILTIGTMTLARIVIAADTSFTKPIASTRFEAILRGLAAIIIRVAIPFVVVAFIWVGFKFAAARGNEEKLTSAKRALTWTVVGTAVIAGVYVVIDLIQSVVI